MNAFILAAGYGSRMKPLTLHTPKALLKVGDYSLIEHHLIKLQKAGIHDIIINVSYLGDQIKKQLGNGHYLNVSITYSDEGPAPLGTGGAIVNALPLLGTEPFILLSADVFSDFPIHTLLDKKNDDAHLVMVNNPDFHPAGDYGISNGLLTNDAPKFTFANYSVWHPHVFKNYALDKPIGLNYFISRLLTTSIISAQLFSGYWVNVGTPEQLSLVNNRIIQKPR